MNLNEKIKKINRKINESRENLDKAYLLDRSDPNTIYEWGFALDSLELLELKLRFLYCEKHDGDVSFRNELLKNIKEIKFRVNAWKNKKFPCQYKD